MRHLTTIAILLLLPVSVGVAGSTGVPDPPVPDTTVIAERPDLHALLLSAALELRGQPGDSNVVTFTPAARKGLRGDGFDYKGFGRPRYVLMRLVEVDSGQVEVGAVLNFVDALLRRTSVSVLLSCSWSEDAGHIDVHSARAVQTTPPDMQMSLTLVPADRVAADLLMDRSHGELLSWLVENRATKEELADDRAKDCYLFAVVYNRLRPAGKLSLRVSETPAGPEGQTGNSTDLNYHGWHVAVLRGQFQWEGDQPFYVKVVHLSGAEGIPPRVLGVLSSDLEPVSPAGELGFWADLDDQEMKIAAGVTLAVGVLLGLLGWRLARVFLFAFGALAGAMAGAWVVQAAALQNDTLAAVIPIASALAGAAVLVLCRWLGFVLVGATVGLVVGAGILGQAAAWSSHVLWIAVGAGAALAGLLRRGFGVFITSVFGVGFIALGAVQWIGVLDVRTIPVAILKPHNWLPAISAIIDRFGSVGTAGLIWLILAGVGLLVFTAFQWLTTRPKPDQVDETDEAARAGKRRRRRSARHDDRGDDGNHDDDGDDGDD